MRSWQMCCKGYNRYPDEKGTERIASRATRHRRHQVTTVTPMKRGLKVDVVGSTGVLSNVTTVTPMKRGLKDKPVYGLPCTGVPLQPLPR